MNRTLRIFALLIVCGLYSPANLVIFGQTTSDTEAEFDAAKTFEQAQGAHERGDFTKALELYDSILRVSPDVAEVEYQRGNALVSLKRFAEAEKSFTRARELRPDWALPLVALGDLFINRARPQEAVAILEKACQLEPSNQRAKSLLAQAREVAQGKDATLAGLRQATTTNAGEDVWLKRALLELESKNTDEALASFNRLIEIAPAKASYRLTRAELLLDAGDATRAFEDVRAADKLLATRTSSTTKDTTAKDTNNLATLYARLGESTRRTQPAQSLDFFRRAAELAPRESRYATGFAAALVQARRYPEATAILRRILTLAPDDYAAHANLATALDEQGNYREALVEFQWLKTARPELAVTDYFIARMHDRLGEYPEALTVYESFLRRADATQNAAEIDRVRLRLESLREQAKKARRKNKN
ncbi:MAG: tetratricopeptide repeat protein [Pyrinomonadaceae bacterium MAG19_C2-C3]|nr:tetratricopeptide repeat protein [Pyrinomonadaceae bacterium MAG19_C2-C3]